MLEILEEQYANEHKRGGHPSKNKSSIALARRKDIH